MHKINEKAGFVLPFFLPDVYFLSINAFGKGP